MERERKIKTKQSKIIAPEWDVAPLNKHHTASKSGVVSWYALYIIIVVVLTHTTTLLVSHCFGSKCCCFTRRSTRG